MAKVGFVTSIDAVKTDIRETEQRLLKELGALRAGSSSEASNRPEEKLTLGQRVADHVAAAMGSWPFIIIQSVLLFVWVVFNVTAYIKHWDPYPFILLNLALSFQAAYAAPVIMMSQNRQQEIDRREAENDYKVNIKAELEIELLHQKIDEMREKEILLLTKAVTELTELVSKQQSSVPAP